jgi:WD40 repeat protein
MCFLCRNEIAYASSEGVVYIRKFSTLGYEMILTNKLEGHFGEVVSVKWNPVRNAWVTGSEDATIRIWVCDEQCQGCCIFVQ